MKNQVHFAESLKQNEAHKETGIEVLPKTASRCRAELLPTISTYCQVRHPGRWQGGGPAPQPKFYFEKTSNLQKS